jgi:hypothetical protein
MSDEIPSDPTLAATVARTSWGQYGATLTLPDGQEHVFAGADLDVIRARVLGDARSYLANQVGHPGRLEVTDPDGTWVLGVPHDGGDPIAIASAPTFAPPSALDEPAAATAVSAGTARTVLLPSRPAIPTGRRSPRRRAQGLGHWSVSDHRLAVLGLFAAVILALALVETLDHHAPASSAANHTRTANQTAAARSSRQPATVSKPKPVAKSAPKTHPATHKPTTPTVTHHHKTAAPKKRRAAQAASHHRAAAAHHQTASTSAPAATAPASAPVVTTTPPVQAPAISEPTHTTRTAPLPSPSGPPPL